MQFLPISAVVPTRNRALSIRQTLISLQQQNLFPAELIIVDGSEDLATRETVDAFNQQIGQGSLIRWMPAVTCGAATQRNQGVASAAQSIVWFFDDDILFEPDCVNRLWQALQTDPRLGGISAMITNQRYQSPGFASRTVFTLLHGRREKSFAGKVIGPAVNLLPEDREDLPDIVPVEWLNTTCTMYRREALPAPPFDSVFSGYSLMEDLTLSLRVSRQWQLANVRTARIFHNSLSGTHKADVRALAAMELANRHYVMTNVLGRRQPSAYLKLLLWEMFQLVALAVGHSTRDRLPQILQGKWLGFREIWRTARIDSRKHAG